MASRPRRARAKQVAPSNPSSSRPLTQDFDNLHFPNGQLTQRFHEKFMGKPVTPSFYMDIDDFSDITICSRSLPQMLRQWDEALGIEERIFENLVRVFYCNMEISANRKDRVVTHVGGVRIEFDTFELDRILGISCEGLNLYTARKELHFNQFRHNEGVRNVCRRRDLSDDICSLPFRSQLLPFQVRILHSILQHMITPRHGHADEVTRLDIGLLDSLIRGRQVHLSFTIVRHMLSTTAVSNRSLPYGSIISKILRYFLVPLSEPVFVETKKLGREIISGIGFHLKQGQWVKVSSSKNADTLVAPDDNRMLNDVYSEEELPDFRLGTRPRAPRRAAATLAAAPPTAAASSQDDEAANPAMPPAASAVPEDRLQQLLDKVNVLSHQQQQLQSDFATFWQ